MDDDADTDSEEADTESDESTVSDDAGEDAMNDGKAGTFAPYTAELASSEGDVVLAFLADWCPSCRGFEADIAANAASIPSNLTVLRVDYDLESELKEKYGVTGQHTFVQIDADGELVMKKRGAQTLDDLVNIVQ